MPCFAANGSLETVLYPAMVGALHDPDAVAPFVDRLSETPDGRGGFLRVRAGGAADPADAARLFEALAVSATPPTDEESGYIVERYVAQGDFRDARALWARLLPRGVHLSGGLVYNGDFRAAPGAPPFNWRLMQNDGASAEMTPASDGAPALHVLAPATTNTVVAAQLLSLSPGSYRLSGVALVEPGQTGDLFAWRLGCVSQGATSVAEVRQADGSAGWRPFSVAFQVPAQGCDAQWLALVGLAHEGFQQAEGWYRGLAIQPLDVLTSMHRPLARRFSSWHGRVGSLLLLLAEWDQKRSKGLLAVLPRRAMTRLANRFAQARDDLDGIAAS